MAQKKKSIGIFEAIKWMSYYIKPYRKWLLANIVLLALLAVINIVKIYFIKVLLENINCIETLVSTGILILVTAIAGSAVSYFAKYTSGKFSVFAVRDIRKKSVEHIARLPISYIDSSHSGGIISGLNNDVAEISGFITYNFSNFIFLPFMALSALVFMSFISWRLVLASMVFIIGSMLITNFLKKRIGAASKSGFEYISKAFCTVQESINGIGTVKSFGLEKIMYEKAGTHFENNYLSGVRIEKLSSLMLPSYIMLKHFPRLLCVLIGGYMAIRGELQLSNLVIFIQFIDYLIQPAVLLPDLITGMSRTAGAIEHLREIMNEGEERGDGQAFGINGSSPAIEFKNVSFQFNESQKVIRDVSFKVPGGGIIALVGPSGAGKSTVINIICGFYESYQGCVNIYGQDLRKLKLHSIREQLSCVSQNVYLFPGTIAENISYGKKDASLEEIIEAAKAANAHNFIIKMPHGYNSLAGEKGVKMSGGQRQLIGIARAFLKNAPILLMDEPTSALDSESERLVQEGLEKFKKNHTVFIVAHRFSTIKEADNVLVLKDGYIAETGTHEKLIEKNGIYKQLYSKQIVS